MERLAAVTAVVLCLGVITYAADSTVRDGAGDKPVGTDKGSAAPSKKPWKYATFDYKQNQQEVRVALPEGLATVRGILVVSCGNGGDSRNFFWETWYGEFMCLHDFAFLGAKGFNSHVESFETMQNALKQIAKDAGHPELVNVPYVTTGFSAGGGFASRLLVEVPDRVIASVPVCARLNFTGVTVTPAMMQTPACIISGEQENFAAVVEPVLAAYRPKGALFGWMTIQNGGHARLGQEVLAMLLLDAAARLRYPEAADVRKEPVKLKTIDPDSGWVADNTTWKGGLVSIAPAKEFKGDVGKSSWLPTEDVAFVYRAYATYDKPLKIVSPLASWPQPDWVAQGQRIWDPGANITVVVDDSKFPGWKKLEFYDGARKFGEVAAGGKPQCAATNLTPGYHVFSLLGTDAQGNVRPSNPVLVVVRKPPAALPAAANRQAP